MYILIYLNLSLMFMFISFLSFIFFLKFLIMKLSLFIELNLLNLNSMNFSLFLYFDYKSFLFIMVVLMISSMIIIYSIEYMKMDKFNIRFIYLLMLFVFSMLIMIVSQNLLMILLGWDGLGLISYCLVIYYNNWSSYNSGMVTILTNRLGDIGLLISISIFSIYGDWNFLINNFSSKVVFIMILIASFTKSAQIPFSSWLPMAMAAPTPISALVHSSTLVTAGVYLLIRFKKILFMNLMFYELVLFLSLMTMFFSGLIANFENDLKKIIALSTLSQLGLMMISVFLGFDLLSFFHLITHAMFKSLLFMCAGLFLHSMINNQDIRSLGVMNNNYFLTLMMFNCSNLSLCGFPFLSGFYSKDLILEFSMFKNLNLFYSMMFYLSICLTILYSFRLIFYMINNFNKFYVYSMLGDNLLMNISMFLMFNFSLIFGSVLNWLIFNSLMIIQLTNFLKYLILVLILFFSMVGMLMNFILIKSEIFLFKNLFNFMKSMWMMNYLMNLLIKEMLILSNNLFLIIDKGWGELIGVGVMNFFYKKVMFWYKNNLEKFILIFFFFLLILLI